MWLSHPTICSVIALPLLFSLCIQNDMFIESDSKLLRQWFEVASNVFGSCFDHDRCSYLNFGHSSKYKRVCMWLLEPTICPVIAVSLFCFSLCIQNDLNLHRAWFEVASTMIRCCFERFRKLFENDRCSYPNFMHIKAPNTCVYVCGYNIQLASVISIYWVCASKTIWIWFGSDSNFHNDSTS